MNKGIIIVGKIPPPYFGPAVATKIILESTLTDDFRLTHIDIRINKGIQTMGQFKIKKIFLLISIYAKFLKACLKVNNRVVLLPIAQETSALYKDLVFIVVAKLFRKKVILHLRGSNLKNWFDKCAKIHQKIFRFWFSKCAAAIVLGENLRFLFEDFLPKEKIHVIPNGANYYFPEKNIDSVKIELLYFANLMENKGLDLLLKALTNIPKEKLQEIHCSVVGAWENEKYQNYCTYLIQENNLPVSIFPPCSGKDKFQFFSNADLFIFTPRKPEGHPWVIVEALSAKLPIISTNQGAITESVIDDFNGFIVSHENSLELKEKLSQSLSNPELLTKFSKNSFAHYQANFTEEIMITKLKTLFLKLLE